MGNRRDGLQMGTGVVAMPGRWKSMKNEMNDEDAEEYEQAGKDK